MLQRGARAFIEAALICCLSPAAVELRAQTTQAVIAGHVRDQKTGEPIGGATVSARASDTATPLKSRTDASGFYMLALISPGTYRIRAEKPASKPGDESAYQPQEVFDQPVAVAARLDIDFALRPAVRPGTEGSRVAALSSGRYVHVFGGDLQVTYSEPVELIRGQSTTMHPTLSYVVDTVDIQMLPLAGRDVYAVLALQPGVTSDLSTGRGLGLSVNGQRPTASNFLLDGLENNNYLVTGPLSVIAPESVQEYRVSTANFSAEYGRSAGYIANAVSRSGADALHGLLYTNLKNDRLNAGDYQTNAKGISRRPLKEVQPGFSIGGPLRRRRLFASLAAEHFRFHSKGEPKLYRLPTQNFREFSQAGSIARQLLEQFTPPPVSDPANRPTAALQLEEPSSIDRTYVLPRMDFITANGAHRFMTRAAVVSVKRPDFLWTPYSEFVTPLSHRNLNVAVGLTSVLSPFATTEVRFGRSRDDLRLDRRWPLIPALGAGNEPENLVDPSQPAAVSVAVTLPGSLSLHSFRNQSSSWEFIENLVVLKGKHVIKIGGEFLRRRLDGYLTTGRDGVLTFKNFSSFAADAPVAVALGLSWPVGSRAEQPPYERAYSYNQFFFYAEDSYRMRPRLSLYYGVRYESFGVPANVGPHKDTIFKFGPGQDIGARIERMTYARGDPAISQKLYEADRSNVAVRLGVAAALGKTAPTLLRAAYGIFYDRPFDNLWQNIRNNGIVVGGASLSEPPSKPPIDYLPASDLLSTFNGYTARNFPRVTLYQPVLRDGYVQTGFLGLQRPIGTAWMLEVNGAVSIGHKLLTNDVINRYLSVPKDQRTERPLGQYRADLPFISYRANQGNSAYGGFTVVGRYRGRGLQMQASYTLGHSIDNQSEPLRGEFFDLNATQISGGLMSPPASSSEGFARQFDNDSDRGNSDFDQRHNVVAYATWNVPSFARRGVVGRMTRGWTVAAIAALRSGFPYSVNVSPNTTLEGEMINNNRANLVASDRAFIDVDKPEKSGRLLLNSAAFKPPATGMLGETARNQFYGPGLASADLSVSRTFRFAESRAFTVRADAFNVLNHANLNNPDSFLSSLDFGIARYGRTGRAASFPLITPFVETARQIQLLLRLTF